MEATSSSSPVPELLYCFFIVTGDCIRLFFLLLVLLLTQPTTGYSYPTTTPPIPHIHDVGGGRRACFWSDRHFEKRRITPTLALHYTQYIYCSICVTTINCCSCCCCCLVMLLCSSSFQCLSDQFPCRIQPIGSAPMCWSNPHTIMNVLIIIPISNHHSDCHYHYIVLFCILHIHLCILSVNIVKSASGGQ
jgi:hypothetical protein